jgi:hypothetical protein
MDLQLFDETKFKMFHGYKVFPDSRIYNSRGMLLRQQTMAKPGNNYKCITIKCNGKKKTMLVHRMVAICFIDNPNNLPEVNHKDFNKQNNNVSNLEWVTRKQNMQGIERVRSTAMRERSHLCRSTSYQCLVARTMLAAGFRQIEVARSMDLSPDRIGSLSHKAWKSLPNIKKEEIINERSKYGNDFIKR